jgi:hypothetical protein
MFGINMKIIVGLGIVAVIALAGIPVASFAADAKQETFQTPEQAVDALVSANRSNNQDELLKILGPQSEKLISSGDPVADKEAREKFLDSYDTAHKLESVDDNKELLIVGDKEWPLPIPLVRHDGKWRFDTAAGEQEILDRRIGRNELDVIEVCRAYVDAQREYADQHHLDSGKHEYAQRFLSHDDKHDGLYWPVNEGEKESPLGPLLAFAQAEGSNTWVHETAQPYHGYYYKILTGQSKGARGGAINYISGAHMTGGFALLAFPAKYGDSGIMTFIVNQDGKIYQQDLGAQSSQVAGAMKEYNPDNQWALAQDEGVLSAASQP